MGSQLGVSEACERQMVPFHGHHRDWKKGAESSFFLRSLLIASPLLLPVQTKSRSPI